MSIQRWEWGSRFAIGKPDFRIVMQEWLLAALNRERRLVSGTAQTSSCEPGYSGARSLLYEKADRRTGDNNVWIRTTWNVGCDLLDSLDCQETVTPKLRRRAVDGI
jgi:hypothetical protein